MPKIWVPAGRMPAKNREFHHVVADVRHTVFSVQRHRPRHDGTFDVTPLGSGFFVSSRVFATCWHVIDSPQSPHQAGDLYRLVNNLDGSHGIEHQINGGIGKDIHLYPDNDFAILLSNSKPDQAYLPISYADPRVGADIGVAGYPLPQLSMNAAGHITIEGMVYRVSRGVINAVFKTDLNTGDGHPLIGVSVLEVNFLFVPGNSGGPIFEANTGRVVAYVKGFRATKIQERQETCNLIPVPPGMQPDYLDGVHAVYSIGLMLDRVRKPLEDFGVKL